jgi:hypothetical protein
MSGLDYNTSDTSAIKTRLELLKTKTTFSNAEIGEVKDALVALNTRLKNNPATDLHQANDSLILIQQNIEEAKEDLKIAEERVKNLRNIDKNKSYYESWFPINRPLRSSSIIICFIFGVFFFSLSFFMFMRYFGFSFTVDISWMTPENLELYKRIIPYGAGIIILAIIILAIVGWVRNS